MQRTRATFAVESVFAAACVGLTEAQLVQWMSYATPPVVAILEAMLSVAGLAVGALLVGGGMSALSARAHGSVTQGAVLPTVGCSLLGIHSLLRAHVSGIDVPRLRYMLPMTVFVGACAGIYLARWAWARQPRFLVFLCHVMTVMWLVYGATTGLISEPARIAAPILLAVGVGGLLGWLAGKELTSRKLCSWVIVSCGLMSLSFLWIPGLPQPQVHQTPTLSNPDLLTRPSVVVVVLDTVRQDHLSTYGYGPATSPGLTEIARYATRYTNAFADSSWSLPSHASLLTGLRPDQHGAHRAIVSLEQSPAESDQTRLVIEPLPLRDEFTTLAEIAQEEGYETVLVAANSAFLIAAYGLTQGFGYVDNRARVTRPVEPVSAPFFRSRGWYERLINNVYPAKQIVAHFGDWLAARSDPQRPFFALLNMMDAHEYENGASATSLRGLGGVGVTGAIDSYDARIRIMDDAVGQLIDTMRQGGVGQYMLVVTSAHGEDFGDHGDTGHGLPVYDSQVRIPLIVRTPGQRQGGIDERAISLSRVFNIVASQIQPAVYDAPSQEQRRGAIAQSYFTTSNKHAPEPNFDNLDVLRPTSWSLIEPPWKYLIVGQQAMLFDLAEDPTEEEDLTGLHLEKAAELNRRLRSLIPPESFTDYRILRSGPSLDAETIRRLRSLGYIR